METLKSERFVVIMVMLFMALFPAFAVKGLEDNPLLGAGGLYIEEYFGKKQEGGVEYKEMKIFNYEGLEMIQLRELADELDWTLIYEPAKREIRVRKGPISYSLSTNEDHFLPGGGDRVLLIKEGRTYLSLEGVRKLLEHLGEELVLTGLYTGQDLYKKGDNITAHLRLYNYTDEDIRLDFPSGQRYDLYLWQDQQEVWRWSEGKFFTMALIFKEIKAGESLVYDLDLDISLEPGEYILGGELATIPERIKLEEVTLRIVE